MFRKNLIFLRLKKQEYSVYQILDNKLIYMKSIFLYFYGLKN
jgi:hypothetical protein